MNHCGIYKYENLINGKIYIGKAKDIGQRKREHRYEADNERDNSIFHKALKKYGEDNFSFEIIEECEEEELDEKEIYWIEQYHSYIKDPLCKGGYNLTTGGDGGQSVFFEKPVLQYTLQGEFVKEYKSASEAARLLNLFKSNITAACRGESSQCGGYQWKYKDSDKKINIIKFIGQQEVEKYDYLGKLIETYKNAKEASIKNNICHQSITACCRGEVKFAGDFQWKYKGSDKQIFIMGKNGAKPVAQVDNKNNLIKIFESKKDVAKEFDISITTVWRIIKNKRTINGYYLKEVDIYGNY